MIQRRLDAVAARLEVEPADEFVRRGRGAAARMAEPAHQTLRQNPAQHRGERIVLQPHVTQPRHRGGGRIRVQRRQHEPSEQGRVRGDLGGLAIADLAHHDDIRILPHDGAEELLEGQSDLLMHLHLRDAVQPEFDRVFHRHDLALDGIQRQQTGVERRRLAAAGRTGHQHDPVRQRQRCLELVDDRRRQTQFRVVELDRRAVEDAHHDRFAIQRRHGGDAEIDLLAAHRQPDAAVLRQTALRDVELRHDLDA